MARKWENAVARFDYGIRSSHGKPAEVPNSGNNDGVETTYSVSRLVTCCQLFAHRFVPWQQNDGAVIWVQNSTLSLKVINRAHFNRGTGSIGICPCPKFHRIFRFSVFLGAPLSVSLGMPMLVIWEMIRSLPTCKIIPMKHMTRLIITFLVGLAVFFPVVALKYAHVLHDTLAVVSLGLPNKKHVVQTKTRFIAAWFNEAYFISGGWQFGGVMEI